jgi:hypothetical protein
MQTLYQAQAATHRIAAAVASGKPNKIAKTENSLNPARIDL